MYLQPTSSTRGGWLVTAERPIAYTSKSLSALEKNYSQLDKEACYAHRFQLITDHKPLLAIFGPKSGIPPVAAARMQRRALILTAYTLTVYPTFHLIAV